MIYPIYSPEQLERAAEDLLRKFDPELLKKPKEYDVYSVIEKCLGVDYSWHYIRPDQKILGLTAFNAGYIWVSPKPFVYNGIRPIKTHLSKGEIVIDSTLTEGNNRGRENFTVMHEVSHQAIHKPCFSRCPADYVHETSAATIAGQKKPMVTALDHIEYQANACAAAFLMPRQTVPDMWHKVSGYSQCVPECYVSDNQIKTMAELYQVSKQAMRYRLYHLGLIKANC